MAAKTWKSGFQRWQERSRSEAALRSLRRSSSGVSVKAPPRRRALWTGDVPVNTEDEELQWRPAAQQMSVTAGDPSPNKFAPDLDEHFAQLQLRHHSLRSHKHKKQFEEVMANPHEVLYTNPVISDHFTCGRSVESTVQDLASGQISVEDIPRIEVVRRDGKLLTLCHRRLYAFKRALPRDALVPVRILLSECENLLIQSLPNVSSCRSTVRVEKKQEKPPPPTSSPGIAYST